MKRISYKRLGQNNSFGGTLGTQRIVGQHFDGDIVEEEDHIADCLIKNGYAFEVKTEDDVRKANTIAKHHRIVRAKIESLQRKGSEVDIEKELKKVKEDLSAFEKSASTDYKVPIKNIPQATTEGGEV